MMNPVARLIAEALLRRLHKDDAMELVNEFPDIPPTDAAFWVRVREALRVLPQTGGEVATRMRVQPLPLRKRLP